MALSVVGRMISVSYGNTKLFMWPFFLSNFDLTLLMVSDMKLIGATAVHLEIRFLPDTPISPPFVRIRKPKFLPFSQGGGGHVTGRVRFEDFVFELRTLCRWRRLCRCL